MATETQKCEAHGEATRLSCVDCGKAVCPKCAVRTEVGLKCEDDARAVAVPKAALAKMRRSRRPQFLVAGGVVAILGLLLIVVLSSGEEAPPPAPPPPPVGSWAAAPDLSTIRGTATATKLEDGTVLVAGGGVGAIPVKAAETFDAGSGSWTPTGELNEARRGHTAAALADGRVLVAGGRGTIGDPLASAEVYDPSSGTWTVAAPMSVGRIGHAMTTLADGRVLVVGGTALGETGASGGQSIAPSASAEIYDPATDSWSETSPMSVPRFEHSASLLPDGKVLIAGGQGPADGGRFTALSTSELYDPAVGGFVGATPLGEGRANHAAVVLANGSVLVAGGVGGTNADISLASVERYDPRSGSWNRMESMSQPRTGATAVLLDDGRVMVAGGESAQRGQRRSLQTAEVYDPDGDEWRSGNEMACPRSEHAAVVLDDGTVLVIAGDAAFPGQNPQAQGCVDRYTPS